jgi:hypothetical protein
VVGPAVVALVTGLVDSSGNEVDSCDGEGRLEDKSHCPRRPYVCHLPHSWLCEVSSTSSVEPCAVEDFLNCTTRPSRGVRRSDESGERRAPT